jgi:hypothetical protein
MPKSLAAVMTFGEPARTLLWRLLVAQSKKAAGDLRNIPRYAFHTFIGLAIVCGLLNLWGACGDGRMPAMASLSGIDPYRISSARCVDDKADTEFRWLGLSPALAVLDKVNPTVTTWVREKHDNGQLVFGRKYDSNGALAKYDVLRRRLTVYREMFCENDGTIAATLCHEYRHSRQNLGKSGQYVLSFLFMREGDSSIIENDAMLYEQEARNAIFGDGRSREKELAAWAQSVQQQEPSSNRGRVSPPCASAVTEANPQL